MKTNAFIVHFYFNTPLISEHILTNVLADKIVTRHIELSLGSVFNFRVTSIFNQNNGSRKRF